MYGIGHYIRVSPVLVKDKKHTHLLLNSLLGVELQRADFKILS